VSEEIEALLGFSSEDFLCSKVSLKARMHREDSEIAETLFSPEISKKSSTSNLRIRHADGRIRCVKAHFTKTADAAGQIVLDLLLQDAKSLKAKTDALPMMAIFKAMMENTEDYIYFKDRNHVITAVSKNMEALELPFGKGSAWVGHTDYDFFPEEYADVFYRADNQVFAGVSTTHQVQQMVFGEKMRGWLDDRKYPIRNEDGAIVGLFGIARDITERIQNEESLRESEEMFREAQASARLGSYVVDLRTGLTRGSEVLNEIYGINKSVVHTRESWLALVHPDDRAMMAAHFRDEVLAGGKDSEKEFRIVRTSDQAVRWVHSSGRLQFDDQGQPVKMRGTIQDITERKQSEEALRESEELLRESQAIAGLGSYVTDIRAGVWKSSDVMDEIFGIDKNYPHTVDGWLTLVCADDRERMAAYLTNEVFGQGKPFDKEYRILRPSDHAVRWVHGVGRLDFDAQGLPVKMCGTIQDITERKKAEDALRESKNLLQLFIEHAPASLAMFDGQMRYLAVSQRYLQENSLRGQEILGRSYYEIFPYIPECWKEAHRRGLAGEELQINEDRYEDADETVHWVRWQLHPWRTSEGTVGGIVIYSEDITERRKAEIALRESRELLRLFVEHAPASLAMFDTEMRYLAVSQRYLDNNGWGDQQVIGRSHYELFPNVSERWKEAHRRGLAGEVLRSDEDSVLDADGRTHWTRWELHPWRTGNGSVGGIVIFSEDITERKKAEEKLRLAANVYTHAHEGIMITGADGAIIDVNERFCQITGYLREEVVGRNPRFLNSGRQSKEFYTTMWRALVETGHWSGEIWNRSKDGRFYAEMLTISAVHDEHGAVQQYVALFSDITELKEHEQQLVHFAHHDVLTGLPNRVLLADRLNQAIAQSHRRGQQVVVAYLDLDGFKGVNDNHGHDAGDQLLAVVASRMKLVLREGDTLARMGGDEFVAVLLDMENTEASIPLLHRLLKAVSQPVKIGDFDLQVTASIGVTYFPQAGEADADLLLRQADQAMYQAKLSGKNRHSIFDFCQDSDARGRHVDLDRIRQALAAREFVLYYQPKVNMSKGTVVGAEALIRWQHPERGLMLPGTFLPVIEDHSLAVELGEWVIDTALAQMERWQAAGLDIPVSVNVGARQLQEPDFVDRLAKMLVAHPRVKPSNLELEIVETSALEEMAQVSLMLEGCRELGVCFALDDFGTGYSSLSYLKHLPADVLKIDRSFVRDILNDPEDLTILEGVLGLATAFRRRFIAEGVETVEHGLMLLHMGCELAQGFGIARPMPAGDFPQWAATWKPDERWVDVLSASQDERQLLYAAVEHRSWIAAIEAFLKGERHVPPRLSLDQCRFSMWMAAESVAGRDESPEFQALEDLHRQIHVLAMDIVKFRDRDRSSNPLARLGELHSLRDALLKQLQLYKQGS
jgi:diguanylate cyclase (GGDEF)-like protein/PAS domain S-box-containing protein